MKKKLLTLFAFASFPSFAAYTGNHSSTVNWLKIYNSDTLYFRLKSIPSDHQSLTNAFVLPPNLTEKRRDRYYSMLLTAKTSGAKVSVGYDKNNPECISGRPIVHALAL